MVKRAVILVEFHKDLVHNFLLHDRNHLEEFGLQGGSPCPSLRSETVQNFMELYGVCHDPFNDYVDNLP